MTRSDPATVTLANAFARRLRDRLTPDQWDEMRRKNASPDYEGGFCASHDYCDSNDVMAAAFEEISGREPKGSFETHYDPDTKQHVADDPDKERQAIEDTDLWNAAWNDARQRHLEAEPEPDEWPGDLQGTTQAERDEIAASLSKILGA